ncbi:MAG: hypothetical protein ACI7YS_02435 [Flavobacterium sp.]
MKTDKTNPDSNSLKNDITDKNDFPSYPVYPEEEDIYNKFKKARDVDPEDISQKKDFIETTVFGKKKKRNTNSDFLSEDLDIPGAELDNDLELMGDEDEENNYYSLGGENHLDLEEDNG